MTRNDFLNGLYTVAGAPMLLTDNSDLGRRVGGFTLPDTLVAREAMETARRALKAEIFNHSLRTFLFAELIAQAKRIPHDRELVFIASILHDAGLAEPYTSESNRFEVDGANLAQSLMRRHRVAPSRIALVWDAIALHDSIGIAKWKEPEVMLVSAGVGADFGAQLNGMKSDDVRAVLQEAPRDGFVDAFLAAVARIAAKKPFATGSCFVTDVGYRMVPGFHLPNFCDQVRSDPFAGYHAT